MTTDLHHVLHTIDSKSCTLVYISMPHCSVCHAILPRVDQLLKNYTIPAYHLDAEAVPEVAGAFEVLTAPAVLLFANGKEIHRQARFIDIQKLDSLLALYTQPLPSIDYDVLFDER